MAEVDTSSYPKPVQSNFMDVAKGYQELERNKLGIDKQKLDLVNQHMNNLVREFQTAPPNATYQDMQDIGQRAVNTKSITPDQFKEYIRNMPTDPNKINAYKEQQIQRLLGTQESLNWFHGSGSRMQDVGGGQQPVQDFQGQVRATGPVVPSGLPAGTPGFQKPTPDFPQGRVAPIGPVQSPGLPVAPMFGGAASGATPVPTTNVQPPNRLGATRQPPTQDAPGQSFNSRFSGAAVSPGSPPIGMEEGLKARTQDQETAKAKAMSNVPALQAYKMLDGLRSGPGTDTWNKTIAFAKANGIIPIDTKNDPTAIYQEVNKKLAQFVQGNGTRSDADLAKKEESSPSVKTQISPALIKLTRDAIGLNNIDTALPGAFEGGNENYGNHRATFTSKIDPRAFTYHLLPNDEKKPLWDEMIKQTRIENGKRVPTTATAKKFFESLDIVKKQGLHLQ